MIIAEGPIKVRLLGEKDIQTLARWLSDPLVLQYYVGRDRPQNEELVIEHYFCRDREINGCMIEYEGKDIGYIQFYPIELEEKEKLGYLDNKEIIYGMDQFIGETDHWDKGMGTRLVGMMVNFIGRELDADKLAMDPQCWNERALRCYEKCGFDRVRKLEQHEYHEGEFRDCWLIEYNYNK